MEENKHNELFEAFPEEEREEVKELWEQSKHAEKDRPKVSNQDVEQALSNVSQKITAEDSEASVAGRISIHWRWVSAAAVLLLMLGAGVLWMPQTVSAPHGEFASVTLPDGSTVELNSGSELQYSRLYGVTNRSVSLDGEAFFSVEKGQSPFVVSGSGASVEVTGTKFNVRSWQEDSQNEMEVAVAEGNVLFYPTAEQLQSVSLKGGQKSSWTALQKQPTSPESIAMEKISAWRDGKLIFDHKSLDLIFRELERRFDVSINLDAPALGGETLTTYYNNPKDVELILKDICRVKGLQFAQTRNGYRVYK